MRLWEAGLCAAASALLGCAAGAGGPGDVLGGPDATADAETAAACLGTFWVPSTFDYRSAREVAVDVAVVLPDGTPAPGVIVSVFDTASDMPAFQTRIGVGLTGADGHWQGVVTLPNDQSSVELVANFMGERNYTLADATAGHVAVELGRAEQ